MFCSTLNRYKTFQELQTTCVVFAKARGRRTTWPSVLRETVVVSFFARKGSPRADLESGHRGYGTSGLLGVDVRVRTKVWKGEGYHINFMFGGKTQVSHKTRRCLSVLRCQCFGSVSPWSQIKSGRSTCRGPTFERIREEVKLIAHLVEFMCFRD